MTLVFLVGDRRIFCEPFAGQKIAPGACFAPVLMAACIYGALRQPRKLRPPRFPFDGAASAAFSGEQSAVGADDAAGGNRLIHGVTLPADADLISFSRGGRPQCRG